MAAPSDLYVNDPEGVFTLTGVRYTESGVFPLTWRVTVDHDPIDWTGCTIDRAQIDATIDGPKLADLTVELLPDGVVTITGDTTQMGAGMSSHRIHPNGRDVVLSVRVIDADGIPFWLVKPSVMTIKHAPGENT